MPETARLFVDRMATPIGDLLMVADEGGHLRAVDWADYETRMHRLLRRQFGGYKLGTGRRSSDLSDAISRYFAGELTAIDMLPAQTGGTPFQRQVWGALREIACGTTISYAELATRVGHPAAVRAVGLANGSNPVGVVVPRHRVIGSNGALTGYGGGIWRKQWLLEHEGAMKSEAIAQTSLAFSLPAPSY